MNKEQKAAQVDEIAAQLGEADAIIAVDYRGISVPDAADLRSRLREADATFRIVKNSLTERAADKAGVEAVRSFLDGPTALTFVRGDAALAAKALAEFARRTNVLEVKGGLLDGKELSVDDIRAISRLPARDVLYTQVVGVVASPLTGLVRGLASMISGLAVALQEIREKGLVQGEEPPAPAADAPADAPTAPEGADMSESTETGVAADDDAPGEASTDAAAQEPAAEEVADAVPAEPEPAEAAAEGPAEEAPGEVATEDVSTTDENQADASAEETSRDAAAEGGDDAAEA